MNCAILLMFFLMFGITNAGGRLTKVVYQTWPTSESKGLTQGREHDVALLGHASQSLSVFALLKL